MWYYYEKKPVEGKLYERFSEIPNFWQDNTIGYRFCSVIHADLQWDGNVATLFDKYIDKNQELDRLKLMTIAGTMLVTGEPQGIGIYRLTGTKPDGTPRYGGHDLICYQVSVSSGKLYISDPNLPAVSQEILFTNNKFQPYMAKLNGNDASNPYPFVTYYAKTAYIEWDKIGKRWDELVNKTIGTVAPNTFPAYTMEIKGTNLKMKEGLSLAKDTLTVNVVCPTSEIFYNVNGKHLIGANVYDKDGKYIDKGTNKYTSTTILKPGKNKLGYYIYSWLENSKDADGKYYDKFIDFKWFNVYYMPLTINPNPLVGEPNTEYKFTARSKGAAPASAKYTWNFGDGSVPLTVINDSTAKHTFTSEGTFKVKVELFDNATNTKIADTTSTASINIKKLIPVIDSLGTRYYGGGGTLGNFKGLFPWGCPEMKYSSISIDIYGKNWSVSTDKTVVKVDGEIVPIRNLISTGGKYEINKTQITIDIPKNKKGKVSIVVESDGATSLAKEYFVGIPKEVLQTLPLLLFSNSFNYNYNDRTSGKITFSGCSDWFYKSTNQIESAVWNGNILTIQGAINWGAGITPTRQKLVCEFSDNGTMLKNIQMDMTSLNVEIRYSVKLDAVVSYEPLYNQLVFLKSKIPVSDYTFNSGKFTWTSPPVSVAINGISESQSSWPNEIRVTFLIKNQ